MNTTDREAQLNYIVDTLIDRLEDMSEEEQIQAIRVMLDSDLEAWRKIGHALAMTGTLDDGRKLNDVLGVTDGGK